MAPISSFQTDIFSFVTGSVRGKDVLDVGCVAHTAASSTDPRWLHKHIVQSARSTLGLDLLDTEAAKLRERGYNIVSGDATTADLGATFDVIVAAELIEHLDNPGGFIRNMRRHLKPGGLLILTTPNPFFALHWWEWLVLDTKLKERWNPEHVCWFDPFTLTNLLTRNDFTVQSIFYFARSRQLLRVLRILHLRCPRPLASSFVTVAMLPN